MTCLAQCCLKLVEVRQRNSVLHWRRRHELGQPGTIHPVHPVHGPSFSPAWSSKETCVEPPPISMMPKDSWSKASKNGSMGAMEPKASLFQPWICKGKICGSGWNQTILFFSAYEKSSQSHQSGSYSIPIVIRVAFWQRCKSAMEIVGSNPGQSSFFFPLDNVHPILSRLSKGLQQISARTWNPSVVLKPVTRSPQRRPHLS